MPAPNKMREYYGRRDYARRTLGDAIQHYLPREYQDAFREMEARLEEAEEDLGRMTNKGDIFQIEVEEGGRLFVWFKRGGALHEYLFLRKAGTFMRPYDRMQYKD